MWHLVQPVDLYGPLERRMELAYAQHMNSLYFSSVTRIKGRPTFNDMLAKCRSNAVNIIANGDIFFDSHSKLRPPERGEAFALSRWNVLPDNTLAHYESKFSQDAWIFRGRLAIDAPWLLGIPGCDNAFAAALVSAGLSVKNPSLTIKAKHVHQSSFRTYVKTDTSYRVPPPYHFVEPSE